MHHRVIGVSSERTPRMRLLHPRIEGIMHKQVHEYRANNTALRRTLLAWNGYPILRFEGRFQPALNVQQHPTIFDVRSHRFHQEIMIKIVKGSFDVKLNNPVIFPAALSRDGDGLLRRLAGSVPVRVKNPSEIDTA